MSLFYFLQVSNNSKMQTLSRELLFEVMMTLAQRMQDLKVDLQDASPTDHQQPWLMCRPTDRHHNPENW